MHASLRNPPRYHILKPNEPRQLQYLLSSGLAIVATQQEKWWNRERMRAEDRSAISNRVVREVGVKTLQIYFFFWRISNVPLYRTGVGILFG